VETIRGNQISQQKEIKQDQKRIMEERIKVFSKEIKSDLDKNKASLNVDLKDLK